MFPGATEMRVQLVTSFDDLLSLKSDWLALDASVGAHLPFQTWEWAIAWWRHLRADRRGVRDQLRVCVLRDPHGAAVAIAPLMLTERPSFGPIRLRHLQFIGADPNITEIRTMLCRPELEEECCRLLREHFTKRANEWDWISWDGLYALISEGSVQAKLIDGEDKSCFVLSLAPDWETMKGQLGLRLRPLQRHDHSAGRSHQGRHRSRTLRGHSVDGQRRL
jgi:hypothetical protein